MFKNWCIREKFNNATNLSHVLMDGGVLSVPFDRLNEFHEKYIEAVRAGEKLFVVEQKSPIYNFFVDIDYKDAHALTIEEIQDVCKIICDKLKRHGGKECLISVSPPKKSGTLTKTGIHLNWPGFVVNQASALALREHILVVLSAAKGSMDWNEIIDASVYGSLRRKTRGSGLRMPWSYKLAKHEACSGQGCETCKGIGKVVQVAYLPVFVYTCGPLSTLLRIGQDPDVDILNMSSVRTDSEEYMTIEPPSATIREGAFTSAQTRDEVEDETLRGLVEQFVRDNMEGQGDATITKMFKHKETYLVSTTSKYCENLKRAHSSNHVWFIISGREILQKCFCRCETLRGRRDGFCKDFCGRRHHLSPQIVDTLYPKKSDIQKCPDIKKFEETPQIKQSEVKPHLETYIQKHMTMGSGVRVVSISKHKTSFLALTTSRYCERIRGEHGEDVHMSYTIQKNCIAQKCPVCKDGKNKPKSKTHILGTSVLNILYPQKTLKQ